MVGTPAERKTVSRSAGSVDDVRESWPQLPRLTPAVRLAGRPGARALDRVERALLRRRLPFRVGGGTPRRELVRHQQRLTVVEVDATATGRSVARANLDLVIRACDAAGVRYFLVPEPDSLTYRVGVEDAHWDDFVSALTTRGRSGPVYGGVGARTRTTYTRWEAPTTDTTLVAALRAQDDVDVFRPVVTRPRGPVLGRQWGCRVERWRSDPQRRLVAPTRNARAAFVSSAHSGRAMVEVAGGSVATLDAFTAAHVFDVEFPIDAVYLWVDGDDPAWQQRKAAALGAGRVEPDAATDARFRDGGELRYALRSLAQYAPWLRRVFLVTDGQVPSWLDVDAPGLTLVDHRDIFGGDGALPTFNSHAIGARLHHIDGLAEHYLYLNDDVFFGRDVTPNLFFEPSGLSRFFLSRLSLGFAETDDRLSHEAARRNVADLLHRDFGRAPTNLFYHSPVPQRRSVMQELEARYAEQFATTIGNQFRSVTDIEPNSWLHHYYAYLTGRAVPGRIAYTYVELPQPGAEAELRRLAKRRDRDVFCINDHDDTTAAQYDFVARWLRDYFPMPSPYEREGTPTG